MLNKVKSGSNMYSWVDFTWNPVKGKCPHECNYCYMKRFDVGELRLDEKCLKDNLGEGNTIFVGSSTDMFAYEVHHKWLIKVFEHCRKYPKNTYLFQSKNPHKFRELLSFPNNSIYGTTIETNEDNGSKAPTTERRYLEMVEVGKFHRTMVSIEPIMDFDLDIMINWIANIEPEFVSIGADSQRCNLPEPSEEKIKELIKELKKFTEVKIKDNMERLGEFV